MEGIRTNFPSPYQGGVAPKQPGLVHLRGRPNKGRRAVVVRGVGVRVVPVVPVLAVVTAVSSSLASVIESTDADARM
ncbi:hypothetical protein VM98_35590 [Streptomyces rubellomurinus subsp. indigoferus]|nr:hypothetical protein VM98_35590 [Streptomyces rubellomurinus subsp. indigoferus]